MNRYIYILLTFFVFLSCNQDDMNPDSMNQEITDQEFLEKFGAEVQRDFTGTLLLGNDQPVVGALVTINDKTTTSNADGVFTINNATVREQFAFIKVDHPDYFHASRSLVPTEGINNTVIRLVPKEFQYQVQSGDTETTVGNSLASVTLRGNYITEDGSTYSGQVNVALFYLFPAIENIDEYMPGMPLGRTEDNSSKYLNPYSTLLVELQGENGEALNLAENSTATIKMKLDGSQISNAPSNIPLWSFDEDQGYWNQEGQAVLEGNTYVSEVSHFSFWGNLDPEDAIFLTINLIDENNMPLPYQNITLQSENNGIRGYFTDDLGRVSGFVPINDQLLANIYFHYTYCDDIIDTQDIGSFNVDTEITIAVEDQGYNSEEAERIVTGVLLNCNNEPITNGIVRMKYGYQRFDTVVDNGLFSIPIYQCDENTEFEITVFDADSLSKSETEIYNIAGETTDIGTITTCVVLEEYVTFIIDDEISHFADSSTFLGAYVSESGENPIFYILASPDTGSFSGRFDISGVLNPNPYVGVYEYRDVTNSESKGFIMNPNSGPEHGIAPYLPYLNNNIIFNLNEVGGIGEIVDLEFSGNYEEEDGSNHFIEGHARFIRTEGN